MEIEVFDGGKEEKEGEVTEEEVSEEEGLSEAEDYDYMKGYTEEEEVETCEECGAAIKGKSVKKEIEGEVHKFCSKACAKEFEEDMG